MGIAILIALVFGKAVVPPPPLPRRDPHIRQQRLEYVKALRLDDADISIRAAGQKPVQLSSEQHRRFLEILNDPSSYYDLPGVMGCIGNQVEITVSRPNGAMTSWFCASCQRIFPAPAKGKAAFDAALSAGGARRLQRLFAEVLRSKSRQCH